MPKCTILKAIAAALDNNSNDPNRKLLNDRVKPPRRKGNGEIKKFQNDLAGILGGLTEVRLFNQFLDRADILIPNVQGYTVIIEIDATRADQVAKKMMSRFSWAILHQGKTPLRNEMSRNEMSSFSDNTPIVYVSLLYPGTEKMNPEECKKYFVMGAEVLTKLNSNNIFIGYIISDSLNNDYCYCSGSSVCGCSNTVSCNCASRNRVVQINDAKAADADLYRKYLEDHGVHSPGSIECYMQPLNIVHNNWKPNNLTLSIKALQTVLAGLPFQQPGWPNSLRLTLNMNLSLGKNQISYWKKYCEYCKWLSVNNLP